MTSSAPEHSFSYLTTLAIGGGFFGLTVVWALYNAYMPLLLGEFIGSRALRGAAMGLDNAFALLLIPIVGAWSDAVRSPLGQRLPFIVVGLPRGAVRGFAAATRRPLAALRGGRALLARRDARSRPRHRLDARPHAV